MWQQLKNIYHLFQAAAARALYGFPARKLTVVGVTGTDGKTTTALLISAILQAAGKKTVTITTLGASLGGSALDTGLHVTTPSSFMVQKLLKRAVSEGCSHAVIETSSHALDQNRVWGIRFTVSVLTNITHEHLDYHGTMERYTAAKMKLLEASDSCVLNADDISYEKIRPLLTGKKITTYALAGSADLTLKNYPFTTKLPGDFNKANCLAAAAVARLLGIPDGTIRQVLSEATTPKGRSDLVYDKEFKVIIDFAVTPNAFAKVLPEVRKQTRSRLIHVFGMSGQRDKRKRPLVGSESARYADVIILTADDPRDENLADINDEIKKGVQGFMVMDSDRYHGSLAGEKLLLEINDRTDAINFAISIARAGDTVLLTGKGHEQSLAIGSQEIPWDEYAAVQQALKNRPKK